MSDAVANPPKAPARPRKKQLAKEYLLGYPGATTHEVARAVKVSPRTVAAARRELRQEDPNYRSYFDRTSPSIDTEPLEAPETLDPPVRAALNAPMSLEERKSLLSDIARAARADRNATTAIQATAALDRIEAREGAQDQLGPKPPLTHAEKVDYTVMILECAGPAVVKEALPRAFDPSELENALPTPRLEGDQPLHVHPPPENAGSGTASSALLTPTEVL